MSVQIINPDNVDSVVETLAEAFLNYPVMQFVLGPDQADSDSRFASLVRLFVMGRVLNNDPMLGIGDSANLDAVATLTLPRNRETPEELIEYRKAVWSELGNESKARYDVLCEVWEALDVDEPQYHINMVGVRKAYRGKGYGRRLVEHVIGLSDQDPESNGVSLTTEVAGNVPFYENLGFTVTGNVRVAPGMETWNFFRTKS